MTELLNKVPRAGRGAQGEGVLGAPRLPQVNLLPNEVRAARGVKNLQRLLLLVIVLVVVVIGGVYFLTMLQQQDAEDAYAGEQSRTSELLVEQRNYAEVPVVLRQVNATGGALLVSSISEILWTDYLNAITAVVPDGTMITNLATESLSPVTVAPTANDVLSADPVARVTFSALSPGRPDTATWIDSLNAVTGMSGARLYTSTRIGLDDAVMYETIVSVDLGGDALAVRFPLEVTK